MSGHVSYYQRYKQLLRAKQRGRWRYPLGACAVLFVIFAPVIFGGMGFVGAALFNFMQMLGLPRPFAVIIAFCLFMAFLVVIAHLIYLTLRVSAFEQGHCQACDYDLTGNVSGICPECGTEMKA